MPLALASSLVTWPAPSLPIVMIASELLAHLEHLIVTTALVMDLRGASIEEREESKESVEYVLAIEGGFLDAVEDEEPRRAVDVCICR